MKSTPLFGWTFAILLLAFTFSFIAPVSITGQGYSPGYIPPPEPPTSTCTMDPQTSLVACPNGFYCGYKWDRTTMTGGSGNLYTSTGKGYAYSCAGAQQLACANAVTSATDACSTTCQVACKGSSPSNSKKYEAVSPCTLEVVKPADCQSCGETKFAATCTQIHECVCY